VLINLKVNAYTSRVASVDELKLELAPFASEQFREIWVSVAPGGPRLCALKHKRGLADVSKALTAATAALVHAT
jgi:hypothetical protein